MGQRGQRFGVWLRVGCGLASGWVWFGFGFGLWCLVWFGFGGWVGFGFGLVGCWVWLGFLEWLVGGVRLAVWAWVLESGGLTGTRVAHRVDGEHRSRVGNDELTENYVS